MYYNDVILTSKELLFKCPNDPKLVKIKDPHNLVILTTIAPTN